MYNLVYQYNVLWGVLVWADRRKEHEGGGIGCHKV